ncbi:type VI secretion system membrane subunit TssM [Pararoseomonas indoligenes]|uniref:Type VI secretion system membrane subunit TssM n=1 Tax=Roseomonas indoligenes TaxID=2820811 RepID=A0A940MQT6_9PROT|nr:type VI secretion system membrane subunit TssM [Pararoseomonas indoligenes]MBP0491779.1 type VI secretion system membrane subunit TssM [Pararoseomonas indoligenes]
MGFLGRIPWRWVLSFVGVALLALLIWLFGPLLSVLEDWIPRAAIILVMLVIWVVANLLVTRRRRRRDRDLATGIAAPVADARGQERAEEVAALGERLSAAMALLRKARGTRGYLYEQPWYAIIGPPGAGKTTALLNAGLKFPLAAEMGQGAVAGVGGTRMCDWWFTEEAVLIDTAGRYTTQDSNAEVDRAGWEGFLALLRRTRPRQPLNGVLVAISLSDIAAAPAEERIAHARAIRRRIKELEEKLAVRLPVYALLTKADLLAGFTEFFDDLDRERREQVWGATFAYKGARPAAGAGPAEGFAAELRLLVERLNDRLLARLQAERSPERRALIAGFPAQVASLEQPVAGFLAEAFGGSRMDPAPLLRGVYLTSGTQEGTPIDRLAGAIARSFGIDQQRAASLRPERGRSYFLHRLLTGVIFGEAMLGSEPPQVRRRRFIIRAASFASLLLVAVLAGGWMMAGRSQGQAELDATAKALAEYETGAARLPLDPVADADLPRLLTLLDSARKLSQPEGMPEDGISAFGLSQRAKLEAGAEVVYRHALNHALLPRMIWRLEAQMRGNLTRPDFLYEASRVYLMLGNQGPLDRALVREWMAVDWRNTYPGAFNAPILASLREHLDRLLEGPLPLVALDGELVAQARATFSRVPLAARVYSRIKPSAAAQALPPWRPSEALGAAGQSVFVRPSGQPLNAGVPGFFTLAGFHRVLLPALTGAVREVASESWVLGTNAEVNLIGPQLQQLEQAVVALYVADYAAAWDAMLQDLDVVPLRSLTQASQDLYILSSPQSPMKSLLESVARQLTLSEPPPPTPGVAGAVADLANRAGGAATGAANAVAGEASRVTAVLGGVQPGAAPALPPGTEIDRRYQALRDLVAGGAGAPISQLLKLLNDLQQQLAKLAAAPIGNAAPATPPGPDPTLALRAEAQRQPQPVARWLLAMAGSGNVLRGGGARQQVAAAYNGAGGPAALCPVAVNGRFPFVPGSAQETPLDDFGRLFAPGGLIDGFFNTQLKPYVDTSGTVWKPQAANGVPAPVSQADVAQFQRAAAIRDLFFSGGAAAPSVRFDITPSQLDAEAKQVSLDFDGTSVTYSHGPPRTTQITWPGPTRMQNVRLVFEPPPAGGTGVLSDAGPWAMFRMFNRGTLRPAGSPERFTLTYRLGERQAVFEIRAGSVNNPFAPGLLQEFRCPRVE